MASAKRRPAYWLFKSEADVYSIDDLRRDKRTSWEGVRNYQARNLLRDTMRQGDGVLFYHSNSKPLAVVGVAKIVKPGYPDPFAFEVGHRYFDPKSDPGDPAWFAVDVGFVAKCETQVTREVMQAEPALGDMMLLRRGSRLSVQPVTASEWAAVIRLGFPNSAAAVLAKL